jgi:hypothetical protein
MGNLAQRNKRWVGHSPQKLAKPEKPYRRHQLNQRTRRCRKVLYEFEHGGTRQEYGHHKNHHSAADRDRARAEDAVGKHRHEHAQDRKDDKKAEDAREQHGKQMRPEKSPEVGE